MSTAVKKKVLDAGPLKASFDESIVMNQQRTVASSVLFGSRAQTGVSRGLANKMRAYQLQDEGLDTIDANTTLGFDDDERDYRIAGRMLQMLNCARIVLLTNNPAKLDGLVEAGIEVVSRMQLEAPINSDNRRYIFAKAASSGRQFEHLTAALAERS
jgi:GTP cyclohydrolase II